MRFSGAWRTPDECQSKLHRCCQCVVLALVQRRVSLIGELHIHELSLLLVRFAENLIVYFAAYVALGIEQGNSINQRLACDEGSAEGNVPGALSNVRWRFM
jgi:hypothetical protein